MPTIDDLIDIRAIERIKALYFHYLDRRDWDRLRTVLTDDAVMDASAQFPDDPDPSVHILVGADRIVRNIRRFLGETRTAHAGFNPVINLDGDHATGLWGMTDHLFHADGRQMAGYGHYEDEYRRESGGWLIARTKVLRTKILYSG